MNAIEQNKYSQSWKEITESFEKPRAIIIFSAHWSTNGETRIGAMEHPDMIYDMYGFPDDLYRLQYPAL